MLSFALNWIIIGAVVYVFGRCVRSDPGKRKVSTFFMVLIFWPISVMGLLVTTAKLVGLLARKHGLR